MQCEETNSNYRYNQRVVFMRKLQVVRVEADVDSAQIRNFELFVISAIEMISGLIRNSADLFERKDFTFCSGF